MQKNYKKGFTLMETLIYIALFAFIMASMLVSVSSLLSGSSRNQGKAMVQEEGSFFVGKVDWVLARTKNVSVSADGLTLTTTRFDGTVIVLHINSGNVLIKRDSNPAQQLNNSNVAVSCVVSGCFVHTLASGDGINPESVTADFTVNTRTSEGLPYSQDFSTMKYLRK